ncbi:acyl homoserine lactone synthase [Panacagrimonas perspica]|uniref:Acyl-homoserine-lactone synthase n=1 Tax=Panacagrimonas perspica TaxID=381431 RepID=A0A4R7NU14_9GAMM|nr:acyl-homoserine-lactone synthase [Panacagrimonas perspica]TDU24232.1 acyl homoserine lactone synthase [Panacagrimonas perspica]
MLQVIRGALHDSRFAIQYSEGMYRLRYKVFHERLGWAVKVKDGQEHDHFDDTDSVYMLTVDEEDAVCGGWRLRPTTRSYMLSDIFPQLLHGCPVPRHRNIWEISRFAVDTTIPGRTSAFSMGHSARLLLVDSVKFAVQHGITQFVLVTSVAVERLIAGTGIAIHRFGPPVRIGRVMSVACWVDVDAHTRHIMLDPSSPLRVAA